jgi:hypothetical protein
MNRAFLLAAVLTGCAAPAVVSWEELGPGIDGQAVRISGKIISTNLLGPRLCVPIDHPNQVSQCVAIADRGESLSVTDYAGQCVAVDGTFRSAHNSSGLGGKYASAIGLVDISAIQPCQ